MTMTRRTKTAAAKKKAKPTPPRAMSAAGLCKALCGVAAFHVEDKAAQAKIYEAVRRLQLLEKAAVDAGLLPANGEEGSKSDV